MNDKYREIFPLAMNAEIQGRFTDAEALLQSLLTDPEVPEDYKSGIRQTLAEVYHKMGRRDIARAMYLELADNEFPEEAQDWAIDLAETVSYRLGDVDLVLELLSRVGPDASAWPGRTVPLQAWLAWRQNSPEALRLSQKVFRHTREISPLVEILMADAATQAPEQIPAIVEMLDRLERTREDHKELATYWRMKLRGQAPAGPLPRLPLCPSPFPQELPEAAGDEAGE